MDEDMQMSGPSALSVFEEEFVAQQTQAPRAAAESEHKMLCVTPPAPSPTSVHPDIPH
jgi:hypothetical protein